VKRSIFKKKKKKKESRVLMEYLYDQITTLFTIAKTGKKFKSP
jgi:hypothetical protein